MGLFEHLHEEWHSESEEDWKSRALKAEAKLKSLELVVICAKDIVDTWPRLTLRMLATMTNSIDTLRQALKESEK